uniref:Uncharacterized protein n=1 Tax=Setaria digitata TaxID=48799 RepID=A0A915PQJ8_9BILA
MFTLCRFRLPSEYFCELLMRTHCQGLNIELSHFDQCFIDDLVLESMPECQELVLSSATPVYFARFTDSTLHRWAVQEKLPRKIFLRNIRANITFDGIVTLINALQIRHPELFSSMVQPSISANCWRKTVYDWDFGCITLSEQNQNNSIVELLSTPGVVTHASRSCTLSNVIDISINSRDFYLLTTKCQVSIRLQLVISSQKAL